MPSVNDVAALMIDRCGPLRSAKLHELLYYSQAWSIALRDAEVFPEPIHAWAKGAVVHELLQQHRNRYTVKRVDTGDKCAVPPQDVEFVGAVLSVYGGLGTRQLTELTRSEAPWRLARAGLEKSEDGSTEITPRNMREYYGHAKPPFRFPVDAAGVAAPTRQAALRRAAAVGLRTLSSHRPQVVAVLAVATYALWRRA